MSVLTTTVEWSDIVPGKVAVKVAQPLSMAERDVASHAVWLPAWREPQRRDLDGGLRCRYGASASARWRGLVPLWLPLRCLCGCPGRASRRLRRRVTCRGVTSSGCRRHIAVATAVAQWTVRRPPWGETTPRQYCLPRRIFAVGNCQEEGRDVLSILRSSHQGDHHANVQGALFQGRQVGWE
jgi:hypothetical protein